MSKFTISQISHVSFLIEDLDKSLHFYYNVLGLVAKDTRPEMAFRGAWLTINESQEIHLLELANPDSKEGRPKHGGRDRHAAFFVDHFDALKQSLEENNISYTLSHSGRAALFFRDIDGNALEFIATA